VRWHILGAKSAVATIDVLLPVLNGLPFLGEAIDSIRSQTFSDWRLLILDHGSTDGSLELAQRYEEEEARIKVFSFPNADGLAGLLNAGLEKCDCRFMFRQDADDISFPNRMELANDVLTGDRKCVVLSSEVVMIGSGGRKIGYLTRPICAQAVTAAAFFYCPIMHGAVAINFPAFNNIGASYGVDLLKVLPVSESIAVRQYAEDYFLFGQLAIMGLCRNIRRPLVKYRIHEASASISKFQEQMKMSYLVSRFLSRSFCRIKNLPEFDPVPFSNHAGRAYRTDKKDLSSEFRNMSEILQRGLGSSPAVRRELAFRWVLATRRPASLLSRYAAFELTHCRNSAERGIVRNWLRDSIRSGWRFDGV
jgi:glycosyltransferase involved in cell wall biosynthesis